VIPTIHYSPVLPSQEWFFIEERTTWYTRSLRVDDAELRTPEGTVVVSSRQLCRILGATPARLWRARTEVVVRASAVGHRGRTRSLSHLLSLDPPLPERTP
jgi:hypothetical protein